MKDHIHRVLLIGIMVLSASSLVGCQQSTKNSPILLEDSNEVPKTPAPTPPDINDPTPDPTPTPPSDELYSQRCSIGAKCAEYPGLVFKPLPSQDYKRIIPNIPAGVYTRVRLVMEIYNPYWALGREDMRHNLFWFVIDKNRSMLGYLFAQGTGVNTHTLRHGFNLNAGEKYKLTKKFQMQLGQTYRYFYIFDTVTKKITLSAQTLSGQEVLKIESVPNTNNITILQSQKVLLDLGFVNGLNPAEPPNYDWEYKNLLIEFK